MDKILYIFLWPSELAATLAEWAFVAVVVVVPRVTTGALSTGVVVATD